MPEKIRQTADLPTEVPSYSKATATEYVISALEATGTATRDDFNVDAIVVVAHVVAGSWDFRTIDPEIFWRIASEFLVDDADRR
jgi:hypothetical protein